MQASTVLPLSITAYIIRKEGSSFKFLLLRRCSRRFFGSWQPVTGKIERHETAWQAAHREIQEETGLCPERFYVAETVEFFYELHHNAIVAVPVFVAFVDPHQTVTISPLEHDVYEWVSYETAIEKMNSAEHKRSLKTVHDSFILNPPNEFLQISLPENVLVN